MWRQPDPHPQSTQDVNAGIKGSETNRLLAHRGFAPIHFVARREMRVITMLGRHACVPLLYAGSGCRPAASTGSGQAASTGSGQALRQVRTAYRQADTHDRAWSPGGTSDTIAAYSGKNDRSVGSAGRDRHAPGASGMIGTELAMRAPADGYTLLHGNMSQWATNRVSTRSTTTRCVIRADQHGRHRARCWW